MQASCAARRAPIPFSPTRQVSHVLAALQAGNRGTQACITAASAVSGIIADLDTTIMFATAGTLNRENAETFADHRYQAGRGPAQPWAGGPPWCLAPTPKSPLLAGRAS